MKILLLSLTLLISLQINLAQTTIDLSGNWHVELDSTSEGIIELPSSLAEKGFGYRTKGSDYGVLTPEFRYVGKAMYSREIEVPEDWENREIEIFLERVLWESRVFIDGKELSRADALGTHHLHHLGTLTPGKHHLQIQVDNSMIHNIGDKGHAYGDYTQTIWNGIVGRMELRARGPVKLDKVKIYPDINHDKLGVEIYARSPKDDLAVLHYEIESLDSGETLLSGEKEFKLSAFQNELDMDIKTLGKLKKWSEFTPSVYLLKVWLKVGKDSDYLDTEFGFSQVSHNGTKILVNDTPVFLRGNLDCVHFPLTGYPSCSLEDWERIFTIYKAYGLNHVRFHSWCPPEAAFRAANRIGIYIQAEASIWIDWWMSTDMVERGRPEMDTKGHPKGLGFDARRDSFVVAEMNRMVDIYGNHPSFIMFCIGNELGNSNFDITKLWVADLKMKDPRRLYAVSTAREITEVDDYSATHQIPDVGSTRGLEGAHTDWDFEKTYSKSGIPIVAHEIGQWPVYPMWIEIEKYTGVLKARNFESFKVVAEKNGIADQDVNFAKASGALNQLMYKYETESFLRTASCAGVQLLSMQDYQGQGEALIGWLDVHWDSKGITTPERFSAHFNTTVPLLRTGRFVWLSDETFKAEVQISHHGPEDLTSSCYWKITNESQTIFSEGRFVEKSFIRGTLTDVGRIRFTLNEIDRAEKLTVSVKVEGTQYQNSWDIWVYPANARDREAEEVLVIYKWDERAENVLDSGGKVLLIANELGTAETSVEANFYPLYWSLTFFPGQGKTCIGQLINEKHPALNHFPTSYHSDWQWETISKNARGFILNELPHSYKPIAQPVDDFHRNNKIGSLFELKVGKGKLLVCGYNLRSRLPVAKQLRQSLLEYMNSPDFNPDQIIEEKWLRKTFTGIP